LIPSRAPTLRRARAAPPDTTTPTGTLWSVFYARWVLLLALDAALLIMGDDFGRLTPNALIVPTLIGAIANVVLIAFAGARWRGAQSVVALIGDMAFVVAYGAVSRGNAEILLITSVALIFFHLLGNWGGLSILQGGVVAATAIGTHMLTAGRVGADVQNTNMLYIVLGSLGALATGTAYALDQTVGVLARQVERLSADKQSYLTDTRERAVALSDLTFILSATLNYKKVLDATLEAGRLALRMPDQAASELIAAIYLYHVDDSLLHVVSARRYTRADELRMLAGKAGVVGQALKEASPVIGEDADNDPELQVIVAFQYCKSLLCIPLRAGFDTFGVIVFGSQSKNAFSVDQSEILRSVGLQSTIALQNAVLYSNLLTEKERIIDADEEARKKLARDLHDGPTQGVAAIAMRMSYIQKLYGKSPKEVPEELKKVEDLARKTAKEMRHMLFTLRPLVLETQGLSAAFNQLSAKFYELYKQAVDVRIEGDVEDYVDSHQQGTIFYIVEEAVNNARKHAQAKRISVTARRQDDAAIIVVADNGVGFNVEQMNEGYDKRSSLGMVNIRDRTEMLDGTVRIESTPGQGTVITLIVPIQSPESARINGFAQPRTKLALAAKQRVERATLDNHLNRQGDNDLQF